MDLELKQSLDRLLLACDSIQSLMMDNELLRNLKETVIQSVFNFIRAISHEGEDDRVHYFNTVYLEGYYNEKPTSENCDYIKLLELFSDIDATVLEEKNIKLSGLYKSFLNELAKYYMTSKYDRSEIDSNKVLEKLKLLNNYGEKQKIKDEKRVEKRNSCESEIASTEGQTNGNDSSRKEIEPAKTVEELLADLNALIGLEGVKKEVTTLINMIRYNNARVEQGYKEINVSKHLVFLGNPGTGKTTVARILSKIYKGLGVLETGQLIEVDREGLVAGYVGQTEEKTQKKIDEAMGGILFIDEAYTLAKGGNDFGQEAIDKLLKEMEDKRDKFVVIVAGYPEPMEKFLKSNPGLRSRFPKDIMFEDYTEDELFLIFESFCNANDLHLNGEAELYIKEYIKQLCANKPDNFANGREMRNVFEKAIQNQANRLAEDGFFDGDKLLEIKKEDFC